MKLTLLKFKRNLVLVAGFNPDQTIKSAAVYDDSNPYAESAKTIFMLISI